MMCPLYGPRISIHRSLAATQMLEEIDTLCPPDRPTIIELAKPRRLPPETA